MSSMQKSVPQNNDMHTCLKALTLKQIIQHVQIPIKTIMIYRHFGSKNVNCYPGYSLIALHNCKTWWDNKRSSRDAKYTRLFEALSGTS